MLFKQGNTTLQWLQETTGITCARERARAGVVSMAGIRVCGMRVSNLHSALETSAHSRCPSSATRRAAKDRFRNLMFPPTRANFPVVNANVRHWFSLTREGAGCSTNRSLLASVSSEHAKTLTVCLPHNYRHEEGRSSLTTPPLCQCACVKARKLGSSKLHVSLIHYLNLVALPGKTTPPPTLPNTLTHSIPSKSTLLLCAEVLLSVSSRSVCLHPLR